MNANLSTPREGIVHGLSIHGARQAIQTRQDYFLQDTYMAPHNRFGGNPTRQDYFLHDTCMPPNNRIGGMFMRLRTVKLHNIFTVTDLSNKNA